MKYSKILAFFTLAFFMLSSCKKIADTQLGDQGQQIIKFAQYGGTGGDGFKNSGISFDLTDPIDSVEVRLEYSSSQAPTQDIFVTVGQDDAARVKYKAANPGGIDYLTVTAAQFLLRNSKVKFRAGQGLSDPFFVIFYPTQLNPALSYMLPIAITAITGAPSNVKASPVTSTAYFHIIGNPLAGNYSNVALRYNYTGTVAFDGTVAGIPAPVSTTAIPATKTVYAIDPDNVWLDFSNLGSATSFNFQYKITQLNNFANISVGYNSAVTDGNSAVKTYLISYTAPSATQKAKFRIITHYNNNPAGGGNDRIIDESLTQL